MSIEIRSTGNGDIGNLGNVTGYTVSIDATPLSAIDSGGGTPSLTIDIEQTDDISMARAMFDEVELSDDENRGSVYGRIIDMSDDEDGATLTVESVLSRLVGEVSLDPYSGTLGDYLNGIIARAGDDIQVDIRGGIGDIQIVMPSITGDAWDIIKALGISYQFDTGMLGQAVTIRGSRSASFSYRSLTGRSHRLLNDQNARNIEITYMNSEWSDSAVIYPRPRTRNSEYQNIISGQPGSLLTVSLSAPGAFPTAIVQPIAATPDTTPEAGASYYYILNGDGEYVSPTEWATAGGSIAVTVDDGGESLTARVRIPSGLSNGPYSIAESIGNVGATRNSLVIYGTGVLARPRTVLFPTGADGDITVDDIGYSVSGPVYMSAAEAYTAALGVSMEFSSNVQTFEADMTMPKLEMLSNDWGVFSFSDLALLLDADTFSDFNTDVGSMTFEEYNESLAAQTLSIYSAQLFAMLAGGRLRYGWANYRITSVGITEDAFGISAKQDVICSDLETLYDGLTCEQLGDAWDSESLTCREVATIPLYLPDIPSGDALYPSTALYPED